MSADTEYKRLIDTAKERASFGFLALMQRALQDADRNMVKQLTEAKSGLDQSALMAVRHFLRQDGNVLLRQVDTLYRNYLERAMQTMYVDIRAGIRKLSAGELSLIDDDVLTYQIEIGRLAQRMRDANEEGIGRLNVIIAQMHGQHDAKERENPFRPYLLARSLYEAVKETAQDELKAKRLFEHLADAMMPQLQSFYAAIREVFETSGIRGKYTVQPSRQRHYQRYFGAPSAAPGVSPHLGAQIMPGLQWMMQAMQGSGPATVDSFGAEGMPATVEELIRRMVAPTLTPLAADQAKKASSLHPIAGQLTQIQKAMASRAAAGEQSAGLQQKTKVRDQLELDKATTMDRMTIEVVSMLFAYMLEDPQIPESLRGQIGRLQVPMLKAAILDPDMMHHDDHPVRQLLNRMSSAAVGVDPGSSSGRRLAVEFDRITRRILDDFDTDSSVFAATLIEFEKFLANHLRQNDARISLGIEALEAAEKISILMTNLTGVLCDLLVPLNVDKRVSDLIIRVWPHALARATWIDTVKKVPASDPKSLFLAYRAVLPDLVWSVQQGLAQRGRAQLVGMLPDLVRRIKATLQMIKLSDEESREIMDLLVDIHAQVLRQADKEGDSAVIDIESLRQIFARILVHWQHISWELEEPPQPREEVLGDVLAKLRIAPQVNFGVNAASASAADREFLAQTYLLGTKVDIREGKKTEGEEEKGRPAQLMWISTHRSLYLFRYDDDRSLVIYTYAALLESLREAGIVPMEYAPVFERAVDSLLFGAGKVQAGAAAA